MKIIDVIIMANGKNSRFGGNAKCLEKHEDMTILEHIIRKFYATEITDIRFNFIIVTSNSEIRSSVRESLSDISHRITWVKPRRISIYHGTASDIYLSGASELSDNPKIVVWSDIIIDYTVIIRKLMEVNTESVVIPVVLEENPYASVLVDENYTPIKFHLSKIEGYSLRKGWHDQCMFLFNHEALRDALEQLLMSPVTYEGELDLLQVVEIMYKNGLKNSIIRLDYNCVRSFNNKYEFSKIISDAK